VILTRIQSVCTEARGSKLRAINSLPRVISRRRRYQLNLVHFLNTCFSKIPLITCKSYHLGIRLPNLCFPSGFHTKTLYPFLLSPVLAICCAHYIIAIKNPLIFPGKILVLVQKKIKISAIYFAVSLNNFMADY
jgi:hypothetical protein